MHRILLLLIFSTISFAQDFLPKIKYNPKKYIAYKIEQPIIIDGKLNDSQWDNAEWTDNFVDIEGSLKPNPFFNTKVKMLWDSSYFYFGAQLEEPHVWATLTQRDAVIFLSLIHI